MHDDDLVLLERWRGGDVAAGNDLFKRHFPSVYGFFVRKVDGEIDDLVQDTFLACTTQRERFARQCTFRTYLFAIARHKLFDHWERARRSAHRIDFEEISIASLSTSVGTLLDRQGGYLSLIAALRALPVEQQTLLELFYWEDLSGEQLAEVFEVELATIRSRLFRARAALREQLRDLGSLPDGSGGPAGAAGAAEAADEAIERWARSLRPPHQISGNESASTATT